MKASFLSKVRALARPAYRVGNPRQFNAPARQAAETGAGAAIPAAAGGQNLPRPGVDAVAAMSMMSVPEIKIGHTVPGMPDSLAETTFIVLGYSAAIA